MANAVANDAVQLLRDKYQDPTGAVLGGLILLKTGGLQQWKGWVENLARDFPWLPDGKVMFARLMFDFESANDTALQQALAASRQRMLYTESYSLLLEMLRRWPREGDRDARREAVGRLSVDAPYLDWESICLSETVPPAGE